MPCKNTIRNYVEGGIYHVYNRGVEKRQIFMDDQDYRMFLYLLKRYLLPFEQIDKVAPCPWYKVRPCWKSNLYREIQLLCYCLMPNHFHLLLKQSVERSIIEFIRRLTNSYIKYFNEKHKRVGTLFQGRYKAALVNKESYLLHLSRYIHTNPRELSKNIQDFRRYSYSSYLDYLGGRHTQWVHPEEILNYFEKQKGDLGGDEFSSYQNFVETYSEDEEHKVLKNLILE